LNNKFKDKRVDWNKLLREDPKEILLEAEAKKGEIKLRKRK
jgi:hypothetical protein